MSLVQMKWQPTDKELRQFGWICLVGFPLVGWLFSGRPSFSALTPTQTTTLWVLLGIGAVLAVLGTIQPQLLKWVYIGLMLITIPIGMVVGEVMFILMYFVVFTPVALFFKVIKRDGLHRSLEPAAQTYWQPKSQPADARRYFRQY